MTNRWAELSTALAAAMTSRLGEPCAPELTRALAGGDISRAYEIEAAGRRWFVKIHPGDEEMYSAEHEALNILRASATFRVPQPLCHGAAAGQAFLVLEHLELHNRGDSHRAGALLAALHAHSAAQFGWHRDNTIGATAQINAPDDDWTRFWVQCRLRPQLALAGARTTGTALPDAARVCDAVPALLAGHRPVPALLHGDLWRGNLAWDGDGRPAVFDPALYYGDREADLAMTELFGGFDADFYAAYRKIWPLSPGYPLRRTLYNLYHVLNHFNLFGGGYLGQAQAMMRELLVGAESNL